MKSILLIYFLLIASQFVFIQESQSQTIIKGRVLDSRTYEPLAFVTIIINDTQQGFMTDIDGAYNYSGNKEINSLTFSYVGYEKLVYQVDPDKDFHIIKMNRSAIELEEVIIFPGENPAHRIISNVMKNRDINNPEKRRSFSFTSYNKLILTSDKEFFQSKYHETGDSSFVRLTEILDNRHLFISESVSNKRFRYPNRHTEIVLANRVSGMKNPVFSILASQLQSFSFYDDFIRILDIEYVSPLAPGSLRRYLFDLQDTIFSNNDTVFIICYRPMINTNFNGMQGILYINSNKWAIQNVIARPVSFNDDILEFGIQQKYEHIDEKQWFPVQLNTDLTLRVAVDGLDEGFPVYGQSRSYISDILLDPPLTRRDFSAFDIDYDAEIYNRGDEYLDQFRIEPLSAKEINTYAYVDSVGQAQNFDRMFKILEYLIFGEVKLWQFSLQLNKLYTYNIYEKHRIGIGLSTNDDFSRYLRISGYYAYGTGDQAHKYKLNPELILSRYHGLKLGYEYENNVFERGGSEFLSSGYWFENFEPRIYYIRKMDITERNRVYLESRFFRNNLTFQLYGMSGNTSWTDSYRFYQQEESKNDYYDSYNFFEIDLKSRFGIGEQFIKTPGRVYQNFERKPTLYINISKGFNNVHYGEFDYLKIQSRFDYLFSIPYWGKQRWRLEAGWVNPGELPLPLLYTAPGSKPQSAMLGYSSPLSFGALKLDEFVAEKYAYVFFEHNFGSILYRSANYAPELAFTTNVGWSRISDTSPHLHQYLESMEKGYFESGITIYKIIPDKWLKTAGLNIMPGIEIIYRYGPYSFDEIIDNFAFKINFRFF